MQRRNENNTVANAALFHGGLYIRSDIQELTFFLGLNGHVIAMNAHRFPRWTAAILAHLKAEKKFAEAISLYDSWGTAWRQNDPALRGTYYCTECRHDGSRGFREATQHSQRHGATLWGARSQSDLSIISKHSSGWPEHGQ